MAKSVYEFTDYKEYLRSRLGDTRQRRGQRIALSAALGCQPTFVTQVLNHELHFSLEQAEKLNRFLGHNQEESDFLFLLLQRKRAGTPELAKHFQGKIEQSLKLRTVLTHRLGTATALTLQQQSEYYSSWHFAAIHIAVAIPELQTQEALARYFKLPLKKVSEVVKTLVGTNLIVNEAGRLTIGPTQVRLGQDSPHIYRHHSNWRIQAMESLDRATERDLHYSGVLCLTPSDQAKIKNKILDALKEQLEISDAAREEDLCCYNIDLFSLRR